MNRYSPINTEKRITTTVVVILFSVLIGLYLFTVDILLNRAYEWLLRQLGAGS